MSPETYAPLIALAIALPLLILRNRRPRTLHLKWMWVLPALIVPLMGLALWGMSMDPTIEHAPFDALSWVILAVGLVLGGVAGWYRGRGVTIERHPDGVLKAQASPIGMILIIALLIIMLHSIVDYPLRTETMAVLFALFAAVLEGAAEPLLQRQKTRVRAE